MQSFVAPLVGVLQDLLGPLGFSVVLYGGPVFDSQPIQPDLCLARASSYPFGPWFELVDGFGVVWVDNGRGVTVDVAGISG